MHPPVPHGFFTSMMAHDKSKKPDRYNSDPIQNHVTIQGPWVLRATKLLLVTNFLEESGNHYDASAVFAGYSLGLGEVLEETKNHAPSINIG